MKGSTIENERLIYDEEAPYGIYDAVIFMDEDIDDNDDDDNDDPNDQFDPDPDTGLSLDELEEDSTKLPLPATNGLSTLGTKYSTKNNQEEEKEKSEDTE